MLPGSIVSFKINDENLKHFSRQVINPKDCVINAMQLLNIIDAKHADLMRILIGDKGINEQQIEAVFNLLDPKWKYSFIRYSSNNFDDIEIVNKVIVPSIELGHVLFCGLTWKSGERHVFILGRYTNGKKIVIDPQQQQMTNDPTEYLDKAVEVYFLMKKLK